MALSLTCAAQETPALVSEQCFKTYDLQRQVIVQWNEDMTIQLKETPVMEALKKTEQLPDSARRKEKELINELMREARNPEN